MSEAARPGAELGLPSSLLVVLEVGFRRNKRAGVEGIFEWT